MRKSELLALLVILLTGMVSYGQSPNQEFKKEGENSISVPVERTFTESAEIFPFETNGKRIFGLDISASFELKGNNSLVRLILTDNNFREYLIYESYELLIEDNASLSVNSICEETSILDNVKPYSIRVEIKNASFEFKSLSYSTSIASGLDMAELKQNKKRARNEVKIQKINNNLKKKGQNWVAGPTSVSALSYSERKKLFGQSTFPAGFEYYAGGVISASDSDSNSTDDGTLKSATTTSSSPYVDEWDWRNRHGKNWLTQITDQKSCGSCWTFAAAGATEAITNLYFNQLLNLDLSEQNLLSCSGGGDCGAGYPGVALDYITNTGIVDELAFPYAESELACDDMSNNPSELIKIGGKTEFGFSEYTWTYDDLKRMLIEKGPISGGLFNWGHAMVLAGYMVVEEGDTFFYRDLNLSRYWKTVSADDPLIGTTVWIFKNSWGADFGDEGYVYVETPITNMGWTYALETPVTSNVKSYNVICEDRDGDGYYWWGLGDKPANCPPCPDQPDGNDADATLGPLDEYGHCISLTASPVPVANYTANKTSITAGESVTFTDQSTNTPTSWSWTFEGGTPSTSTAQNPAVTYNTAGTYNVTLTASNADGSDTKTMNGYIQVAEAVVTPVADFSGNPRSVTEGEEVTFSDLSGNEPTSWSWTFEGGDPATSTAQNPKVSYHTAGNYQVTLIATNAAGSNTKVLANYIDVNAPVVFPVANFTANKTSIIVGESVIFTDLSTDATSWSWTFEGGTPSTSTAQNPAVTYNTAGTYNVTLTASNADGSDTKTMNGYIQVAEAVVTPVADFSGNPRSVTEGEEVTFSDLSGNEPTSWSWTFEGGDPATSTAQNPKVSYHTAGNYQVTLVATNAAGSNTKVLANYIEVNAPVVFPVANFTANNTSITTGQSVNFSDLSTDATSWSWTFEGGTPSTSTAQNPAVTYNTAGTYNVTLTASNANGSDTKTMNGYIEVSAPAPAPIADFSADYTIVTEGQDVTFSDKSANDPVAWSWTFEGGEPATSNLKNPKVKYNTASTYKVSLTVTNASGSDTKIIDNYIQVDENTPTYCSATGSPTNEWIAGVKIEDQTKTSGANGYSDFSSFAFNLGSGASHSITLTPRFASRSKFEYWAVWIDFNQDMVFSSTEKVFSSSKSKSTVNGSIYIPAGMNITTRMRVIMSPTAPSTACGTFIGEIEDYTVNISEPAPEADFTATSTSIAVGESIQFTNTSKNNPTSIQWYFDGGDISTSTSQAPIVTYNTSGEYAVTLVVSNDLGSSEKSIMISVLDDNSTQYCTPTNISAQSYIQSITFNGQYYQTGDFGYELSSSTIDNLYAGQNYKIDLYPSSRTTRNFWRIWIDFNMDGVFDDATENVLSLNNKKGNVSGYVSIPASAYGTTRMRIAMKVGGSPLPCEDGFIGEVEDYQITINEYLMQASAPNQATPGEIFEQINITVYPNPTSDYINIQLKDYGFDDSFTVHDMNGKVIIQEQINSATTRVDLSTYPQGMYLIKVKNNNQIQNKKIIKR